MQEVAQKLNCVANFDVFRNIARMAGSHKIDFLVCKIEARGQMMFYFWPF